MNEKCYKCGKIKLQQYVWVKDKYITKTICVNPYCKEYKPVKYM